MRPSCAATCTWTPCLICAPTACGRTPTGSTRRPAMRCWPGTASKACSAPTTARRSPRPACPIAGPAASTSPRPPQPQTGLPHCGASRIDQPAQADAIVARHVARGDRCLTLHAGTGLEDDAQASRLVEALLTAADKHRFAVFLETHRATITQDLWRTVQLVRRFPELRLNGDFSHYYCGQEMTYG